MASIRRSSARGSTGVKLGGRRLHFVRACLTAVLTVVAVSLSPARAAEAINVRTDAQAIDLTDSVERHRTEADRLLVSAPPGPDRLIRRMAVPAPHGTP